MYDFLLFKKDIQKNHKILDFGVSLLAQESNTPDFVKECKKEKEKGRGRVGKRERKLDRERKRIGKKTGELCLVITENGVMLIENTLPVAAGYLAYLMACNPWRYFIFNLELKKQRLTVFQTPCPGTHTSR